MFVLEGTGRQYEAAAVHTGKQTKQYRNIRTAKAAQ